MTAASCSRALPVKQCAAVVTSVFLLLTQVLKCMSSQSQLNSGVCRTTSDLWIHIKAILSARASVAQPVFSSLVIW